MSARAGPSPVVFIPNPILGCRRSNTAATLAERCSGAAPRLVRLEQSVAPAAPTCHDDRQTLVPTEYLRAAWRTCGPAAAAARSLRSPATLTSRDRVGDIGVARVRVGDVVRCCRFACRFVQQTECVWSAPRADAIGDCVRRVATPAASGSERRREGTRYSSSPWLARRRSRRLASTRRSISRWRRSTYARTSLSALARSARASSAA